MANSLLILLTRDKFRVLVLVACAAFFLHGQEYEAVQDDAFISFVYSKHLAAGEGLVFNLGERVEGYTNFLWVALMALPHLFSVDVIFCARFVK
jgi:hypothetical protein